MRNMPEPGMEDSGGNPLQEGVLGDYQNRGVRDESYASVKKATISLEDYFQKLQTIEGEFLSKGYPAPEAHQLAAECLSHLLVKEVQPEYQSPVHSLASTHEEDNKEPEFEVTGVLPPDPGSIRLDKEQMDKQAGLFDDIGDFAGDVAPTVLPIAGGIAGGAVGALTLNPAGVAAGAAIGAGLGGAAGGAMHGDDFGQVAQDSLTDAALGGIGGGLGGALKFGGGAAAEAAAQGTTKGGIGSMMKSSWGKVPTDKLKSAYMTHALLSDAGGAMQTGTQMGGAPMQQPSPVQAPSFYSATETPTSQGHIPSNDTSNPEEVDFKEKNDGEKDGLQSDQAVNGGGGTDLGPDQFFAPDSGALDSFAQLLPKILEFATSDKSAAGDPDMEDLHQKLEAEMPGYMNEADDDHGQKMIMFVLKGGSPDGEGADDLLQDNDQPHDPISEHEATALRPGLENTCPRCGSMTDPSSEHCPQCGMANPQHQALGDPNMTNPIAQAEGFPQAVTAAAPGSQGPNTDEQKALVATKLQEEGRGEEVPTMILEPWNYADDLAAIQQTESPPEDIGQATPPPPVPPEQQGEMPMPGMTAPGGPSGPPMMAAISKYVSKVDGLAEACPKCGSHTTGYLDPEGGDCGCKRCGNTWKSKPLVEHGSAVEDPTDLGVPPVDDDLFQEDENSSTWSDESGAPLQVGQTYDMYSENYDIPDRVKIDAVKPDVINYTLVGEYGLSHSTELTHEEASLENLSFVPADPSVDQAPEEAEAGAQPVPGPGDQTDLSTPHEMMASRTADFDDIHGPQGPNVDGGSGPLPPCPHCGQDMLQFRDGASLGPLHPDGAYECANCFNSIEPHEMADKLTGTPQENEPWNNADPLEQQYQTPATEHPLGAHTGAMDSHEIALDDPAVAAFFEDDPTPVAAHEAASTSEDTGPDWLMEGVSRTAGASMTPWEQRDYIDEVGDARNSDKLNLQGTHYEMGDDLVQDSFF